LIYEQRTYRVKPGLLGPYLKLFEDVGMPVRQHYGRLVGFWFTEFGELNQVVHIWAYESLDQRTAIREALMKDRQWVEDFLPKALPMLDHMQSIVMVGAPFSPLR
jgi:hypothetical protein